LTTALLESSAPRAQGAANNIAITAVAALHVRKPPRPPMIKAALFGAAGSLAHLPNSDCLAFNVIPEPP
jgi:hypothetical protein